jgi:hypothetical protein
VTSFGSTEEHALHSHGRGELPLGRCRGRWCADRGRRGDHAGGRAGRPQRRRGQRAGLPPRDPLGGPPGPSARVLLAAGHSATQPDDGPRDRGPGLPAAIAGQGGRDPACCDAGPHRHPASPGPASPGPARPAASGAVRLAGLAQVAAVAVAVAVGPVRAPPPLDRGGGPQPRDGYACSGPRRPQAPRLSRHHRRSAAPNHGDVALPWSGPRRCGIAVVLFVPGGPDRWCPCVPRCRCAVWCGSRLPGRSAGRDQAPGPHCRNDTGYFRTRPSDMNEASTPCDLVWVVPE